MVRTVKVRPPREGCPGCALVDQPLNEEAEEYAQLCAVETDDGYAQGEDGERISASELRELLQSGAVVVDTRPPTEFAICSLPGTTSEFACESGC